jgi:hypothetical protein
VLSNAGSSRLSGTATATGFVALVLPMLPAHRTLSHLRRGCRTPLENLSNSSSWVSQSSSVLLSLTYRSLGAVTVVTTVTTLWEGVLDLWSGHARLLPCLWCEPKGVLRICGDSGDERGTRRPSYSSWRICLRCPKI